MSHKYEVCCTTLTGKRECFEMHFQEFGRYQSDKAPTGLTVQMQVVSKPEHVTQHRNGPSLQLIES